MSLASTTVKFRIFSPDGEPIEGARVHARLTRPDTDAGAVVPSKAISGMTDEAGECLLDLWPNSRGTTGSQYEVTITRYASKVDSYLITVAESLSTVLVESIKSTPPYPTVSAAQQALEAAQQAVIDASNASRLTIGTVTTGAAGTDADAEIVGDAGEQVLNLTIPRGDPGTGGEGGSGATNLAYTASATQGTVTSDTGTDATLPAADGTNAGLMLPAQVTKLAGLPSSADPAGTASAALSAHTGAADPHGDRAFSAAADAAILASANAHAESLVVGLVDDRGNFDASGNAFPASGGSGTAGAVLKGDLWTVSVAGTLGGKAVTAGDLVRALVDAPWQTAGNWAVTENNIGYVPANSADKDASGGFAGLTGFKLNLVNALGTITSWFTTAATAARTWTLPDKSGTVAMTSDIPAVGTTAGTVAAGDDSRLSDARTPTAHTHALSALTQSSATTGQVATWNGSAWAPATPGSGGTKTFAVFSPLSNQPPASAFATLDTRNSVPVLDFDAAADESAVFSGVVSEGASLTSGIMARIVWMATSATSGNVRWRVAFERRTTDQDSDSFDTATEATSAANGTSGICTTVEITCTTIDSIVAGDSFRVRITRVGTDATNDTMTGDAELVAVELRAA